MLCYCCNQFLLIYLHLLVEISVFCIAWFMLLCAADSDKKAAEQCSGCCVHHRSVDILCR